MIVCTVIGPEDLNAQVNFPFPPNKGEEIELIGKVFTIIRKRWIFEEDWNMLVTVE